MQLTCNQKQLEEALRLVSRAAPKRSTLFVLSNVLLEADAEQLKLSATNLEISATQLIDADVTEAGAIAVPVSTLYDLVKLLPDEPISLSVKDFTLKVSCGKNRANIKGVDATEFPTLPSLAGKEVLHLPAEPFQRALRQGTVARAMDEGRPILTGVLVNWVGNTLKIASADGFRLAERVVDVAEKAEVQAVIAGRALEELAKVKTEGGFIDVAILENQVIFGAENVEIASQIVQGNFPDYKQIIPKESTTTAIVSREALLNACKTTTVFAKEASYLTKFTFSRESLELSATSAETGDGRAEIDADVMGEPITIAFNANYMVDILSVSDDDMVTIGMTTPSSPCVLKPKRLVHNSHHADARLSMSRFEEDFSTRASRDWRAVGGPVWYRMVD